MAAEMIRAILYNRYYCPPGQHPSADASHCVKDRVVNVIQVTPHTPAWDHLWFWLVVPEAVIAVIGLTMFLVAWSTGAASRGFRLGRGRQLR